MKKIFALFFVSLSLMACSFGNKPAKPNDISDPSATSCINDWFRQGEDDNLYGKDCLAGKKLFIQTAKDTGHPPVTTTHAINKKRKPSLRVERSEPEEVDFINKFYDTKYTILEEGDYSSKAARQFLPSDLNDHEKFFGLLDHKYQIVFDLVANYLILFKASKNLQDLPYTERNIVREKNGLYMVPFLGYPVQYCNATQIFSDASGHDTYRYRTQCDAVNPDDAKYIRINKSARHVFLYQDKKDLFPAEYFEGRWFYTAEFIETPATADLTYVVRPATLVELDKNSNFLEIRNVSGDVENRNQELLGQISVKWVQYEMDIKGSKFNSFGERESQHAKNPIARSHLMIDFPRSKAFNRPLDFLVADDFFSFVVERLVKDEDTEQTKKIKYKVSFLKESAVDQENFHAKKYFKEDYEHKFASLPVMPQQSQEIGEFSREAIFKDIRLIHFNTSNPETVIKWHFSNKTPEDPFYRQIGREAVDIWNQAFKIITQGSDTKIKVVLEEKEEKDIGDMRYNVINMIQPKDMVSQRGLLGIAPSFANPETGQIIGTTANVNMSNIKHIYNKYVQDYIRYEIFRKNKATEDENKIHSVSPYIKTQIQTKCPEVDEFIKEQRRRDRNPRDNLGDIALSRSCEKKISRDQILATLIHEMGHSFGLGHNFRASTDKDNYYQSINEMESYFPMAQAGEISKTSSVMDYLPMDTLQPVVPGKYDLSALRYLYMDQVETKKGEFLALNTPEDPDKQKALGSEISSQMKPYAHCAHELLNDIRIVLFDDAGKEEYRVSGLNTDAEDFLCLTHDYGSNPLEIVRHEIDSVKRAVNQFKYRYDRGNLYPIAAAIYLGMAMSKIPFFYSKWVSLRNIFFSDSMDKQLSSQLIVPPFVATDDNIDQIDKELKEIEEARQRGIDNYQEAIQQIADGGTSEEYAEYYPIREEIFDFFMDMIFTKTMKCAVQTENKKKNLNLESIRPLLLAQHGDDLYVRDCYSPHVRDFLEKHGLELAAQSGVEHFESYNSKGRNKDRDLFPEPSMLSNWVEHTRRVFYKATVKKNGIGTLNAKEVQIWPIASLMPLDREPGFLNSYLQRLKKELFHEGAHKSSFELSILRSNFGFLMQNIMNNIQQFSTSDIRVEIKKNLISFFSVTYKTGTGPDSFFKLVSEPLANPHFSIESVPIPFIRQSYKNYQDYKRAKPQQANMSFEEYLTDQASVLRMGDGDAFTVPYAEHSLMEKVIKTYNQNLKAISALKEKSSKSILEEIEHKGLIQYNETLLEIAQLADFIEFKKFH